MGAAKKNKTIEGQTVATSVKGLATGSWIRVATTTAETKGETTSILYDAKYHPIRSYTSNYLGGYTGTDSKVDAFTGQLQYTLQKHKRTDADAELIVKEAFTYSAQDRLIKHTHQINGGAEQLLAENTYDELGQLVSKKVGNTSATPLQKVDYSYNIRGWMKTINNPKALQQGTDPTDLFAFKINYNTVEGNLNAANKLYNGNIAETFWSTATDGGFVRNYGYQYDNLNRLKDATYQKSSLVTHMYDENLTYDKNGNIVTLKRNGDSDTQAGTIGIDNLTYGYATNSNKLMRVTEAQPTATSGFKDGNTTGDDYMYDANGNMTVDKNKHITAITYNHLNLPTKIIFPTGNIVYFYNASGQKVQKVVTENATVTTTDYLGGYQYQNTVLQFFPTAEGYVKNTDNVFSYVYNYTDHLGNIRLSYTKDTTGSLKILEENNYYPFGLKHTPYNADNFQPGYKYKYNGKELQDENIGGNQLNLYDFGARNYDPALGRWMNVDPLAEKFPGFSPYNFCLNNPIRLVDPDGQTPTDVIVLGNSAGAGGVGHQAVLVGDDKKGWIYISKDGAAKSGGAHGESRWTAKYFKSVDEFKNSGHNFETAEGVNHSNVGGGENKNMSFKLDENGNKIQRYDQAYRIETNGKKDNEAIIAGIRKADQDYTLTTSDCSDIPTTVLNIIQGENGKTLKNGENGKTSVVYQN